MPDIFLRQGNVNPTDISLCDPTAPGITYYGILKRWATSTWVKAKLMVYVSGTWVTKPLKRWNGSEWKLIDTRG